MFTSQSQRDPRAILPITLTFSMFETLEYILFIAATLKQLLSMLKLHLPVHLCSHFLRARREGVQDLKGTNLPSSLFSYYAGPNMYFFEAQRIQFYNLLGNYHTSPSDSQFPIWEVLDQNENKQFQLQHLSNICGPEIIVR